MTNIEWLGYNGVILFDSKLKDDVPAYGITWRTFHNGGGLSGSGNNQEEAAADLVGKLKEILSEHVRLVERL